MDDRPVWRPYTWILAGGILTALMLVLAMVGDPPGAAAVAAVAAHGVAVFVMTWALMHTRAQRHNYELELAEWAAERAAQRERLRIAGDLHDLVSHGLGLITIRASVARRITDMNRTGEWAQALADIEQISRDTTTELRRMLAVLRVPNSAPLRPADTLADLPAIAETARSAGLTTSLHLADIGEVSSGAQHTLCVVVREALSNTIRHAGPTTVRVDVRREDHALVMVVEDDGPGELWQPRPGAGHGIEALRQRVAALDGVIHAAPVTPGPGFRLVARIAEENHR